MSFGQCSDDAGSGRSTGRKSRICCLLASGAWPELITFTTSLVQVHTGGGHHNQYRVWQSGQLAMPPQAPRKWSRVTQSTLLSHEGNALPSSPYHQFASPLDDDPLSFAPSSLEMFHDPHISSAAVKFQSNLLRNCCSVLSCSDSLQAAVSALYAKLLIILGLALPLTEVLSDRIQPDHFHLFYVYLFLVSTLYLLFVYMDLVQIRTRHLLAARESEDQGVPHLIPSSAQPSYHPPTSGYYGSFYLRLGTVGRLLQLFIKYPHKLSFAVFGIGSLIYTGMELGEIFEDNRHAMTTSRWCH